VLPLLGKEELKNIFFIVLNVIYVYYYFGIMV
jgi:hypothetical protein